MKQGFKCLDASFGPPVTHDKHVIQRQEGIIKRVGNLELDKEALCITACLISDIPPEACDFRNSSILVI